MSDKRERMKAAVAHLTSYMVTYTKQEFYEDYTDKTYIDDILYGLGISLGKEYTCADGFDKFKDVLRKHLEAK